MFATGGTGLACYASYLAMALTARKIASTIIGYIAYPAAAASLLPRSSDELAEQSRAVEEIVNYLKEKGYTVKNISLYKSGIKYDGLIVTHASTSENGKWTINALGYNMKMEDRVKYVAGENFSNECNTLIINGPSVGQSGGWPTRYQMGAGFEAGLQYLEHKANAKYIIMHGFSLGGGMMAEAILNHDFKEGQKNNIHYLSISDRSFSRLSTSSGAMIGEAAGMALGKIVELIFYITGTELDGVRAAQKLSKLAIKQFVIQHNDLSNQTDGVILDSTSLAYELKKEKICEHKVFMESALIQHNELLPLPMHIQSNLHVHFYNKFHKLDLIIQRLTSLENRAVRS